VLRGRGYVQSLADLESSVVAVGAGGTPIRLRDVARVQFGPEIRRGAADWNGKGEAVGGIVVMRVGSNALQVNDAVKAEISRLSLPQGVRVIPTYDRSDLILGSIATLQTTLIEEGIIVFLICVVFLFHVRSAIVAMTVLPLAVLTTFIGMRALGLTANIMSLGGIAIAVGELADAVIVLIENAHVRLAAAPKDADRKRIIVDACKEVGRPIFFSLLLITVSFLPIFTLAGQAGRLFSPLAYTKTFALRLQRRDVLGLLIGQHLGHDLIESELTRDDLRGRPAVAREHHNANSFITQWANRVWSAGLDRIGHAEQTRSFAVDRHVHHGLTFRPQRFGLRIQAACNSERVHERAVAERDVVSVDAPSNTLTGDRSESLDEQDERIAQAIMTKNACYCWRSFPSACSRGSKQLWRRLRTTAAGPLRSCSPRTIPPAFARSR
jgi:Cu/Ag efflux pump CusA